VRCPDCRLEKTPDEFTRNRSTKTGFGTYCKSCFNVRAKASKAKRHGSERNYLLKHRCGVDETTVAWLRLQQNDRCAICLDDEPGHLDHDHGSGSIRGLLCFGCNRALGYVRDDVELLEALLPYLRRHGVREPAVPYLCRRRAPASVR